MRGRETWREGGAGVEGVGDRGWAWISAGTGLYEGRWESRNSLRAVKLEPMLVSRQLARKALGLRPEGEAALRDAHSMVSSRWMGPSLKCPRGQIVRQWLSARGPGKRPNMPTGCAKNSWVPRLATVPPQRDRARPGSPGTSRGNYGNIMGRGRGRACGSKMARRNQTAPTRCGRGTRCGGG